MLSGNFSEDKIPLRKSRMGVIILGAKYYDTIKQIVKTLNLLGL